MGAGYGGTVTWLTETDEEWTEDDPPRSHLKLVVAIVVGWLMVSVIVLAGLILLNGPKPAHNTASKTTPGASTATAPPPAPTASGARLPDGWVQAAADDQSNCANHSYGKVEAFFSKTPCTSLHRVLATTNSTGHPVVIASNVVTFATAEQASQYEALVTSDGTGNINDLLREGATVAGVTRLPAAAFASRQDAKQVWVAEAAYTDGNSDAGDAVLKAAAQKAIGPS